MIDKNCKLIIILLKIAHLRVVVLCHLREDLIMNKEMGPLSKGAAFAFALCLFKFFCIAVMLSSYAQQYWQDVVNGAYFTALTTDLPLAIAAMAVLSSGMKWKDMIWMLLGFLGIYLVFIFLAHGAFGVWMGHEFQPYELGE